MQNNCIKLFLLGGNVSLIVNPKVVEMSENRQLTTEAFISVVKDSLPYAWKTFTKIKEAIDLGAKYSIIEPKVNEISESERGELLRALASTSMRNALESYFGFKLAFQNCHRTGGFIDTESIEYKEFISMEEQILNQNPEFIHC
jgi:hypothetical protein